MRAPAKQRAPAPQLTRCSTDKGASVKRPRRGRPRGIEAVARRAEQRFKPVDLPVPVAAAATSGAQERLRAAAESVNNVLLNMELARAVDRDIKQKALRGRLSEAHIDLLRAAIVFAGAGLDASLKELIRGTIREVWTRNDLAREKFQQFAGSHLAPAGEPVSVARLAEILASPRGSQDELLKQYERSLTGGSLQSAQQVAVVCSALGVQSKQLRERLKEGGVLDQMFRARNEIIHELDLAVSGKRSRPLSTAREFATQALSVTQEIINAVSSTLSTPSDSRFHRTGSAQRPVSGR